jgi:hypothetical protein
MGVWPRHRFQVAGGLLGNKAKNRYLELPHGTSPFNFAIGVFGDDNSGATPS